MLRLIVLLLLIANLGCWALVSRLGSASEREPERLARQLRPEAMAVQPMPGGVAAVAAPPAVAVPPAVAAPPVVAAPPAVAAPLAVAARPAAATHAAPAPSDEAASPDAGAPVAAEEEADSGSVCLQAGMFDARQAANLRAAAGARLPPGSWRLDQVMLSGRWMVYIGKLDDEDEVAAKRAEVRALGVATAPPGANFEPGLSLGRFTSEETAQRALAEITRKGVRSARVVQERSAAPAFVLRLPAADAAVRDQLRALRPALAGREVQPCG